MRVLVVGAGSTGGYFGGRLSQAGRDVTFLVRPRRAEVLRNKGLKIESPHGDVTLSPKVITASEIQCPFNLILLSVKSWSLVEAMEDFSLAVADNSMILPVLNGMKHLEILTERFGAPKVIGGVCKVATVLDADGNVVQLSPLQELTYGEMSGEVTDRMRRIDTVMQGCGFDARLSTEIERLMWEKWALLATLGGATCLMRGNVGQIVSVPGGADFIANLFDEIRETIKRLGCELSEDFVRASQDMFAQKDSQMTSSMYRDLEKAYRIEREQIIDDLIARGRQIGLRLPLLTLVSTNLAIYESRLR